MRSGETIAEQVDDVLAMVRRKVAQGGEPGGDPPLDVAATIRSDFSDNVAEYMHLLPHAGACEGVVFCTESEDLGGYAVALDRLRRDPQIWAYKLASKLPRPGHRRSDRDGHGGVGARAPRGISATPSAAGRPVSLISGHGAVLLQLEREPGLTVEELARRLGVSARTIRRVITQLEESGVVVREREGNRNRYRIDRSRPACESAAWLTVGEFLERLAPPSR